MRNHLLQSQDLIVTAVMSALSSEIINSQSKTRWYLDLGTFIYYRSNAPSPIGRAGSVGMDRLYLRAYPIRGEPGVFCIYFRPPRRKRSYSWARLVFSDRAFTHICAFV